MRIAFFCPHSDPLAQPGEPDSGGQCVYEARVAAALAKAGHEIRCYTRRYDHKSDYEPITERTDGPGSASVFRYPMGPKGFVRKEDMGPLLPEITHRILDDQQEWLQRADVLHGHYWDGGAAALQVSIALAKHLVFTSHSLGLLKRDRVSDPSPDGSTFCYRVRIAAEKRILWGADRVVALSGVERDALTMRYGVEATKIRLVPGGVDAAAFSPRDDKSALKTELGIETELLIFTVGRLEPRKGFVEFIGAIPHVLNALSPLGKSVTFAIPAGQEHPSAEEAAYKKIMDCKVAALQLGPHIHWFQRLSDAKLKSYYAASDLFVCPSLYEPFGLVLVEAFAAGTPVVATCHGGPPELVTSGTDGYLAEPRDPAQFAARIADVIGSDDETRHKMSEKAIEKVQLRYDWKAVAVQLAQVYRGMLTDLPLP